MSTAPDPIRLVEVGYAPADAEPAWLASVIAAARPSLDAGLGVIGFFFDRRLEVSRCVWGSQAAGADERVVRAVPSLYANLPPATRHALLSGARPIATASDMLGTRPELDPAAVRAAVETFGFGDSMGVAISDASGRGCLLAAPLASPRPITDGVRRRWARLTAHLAAGLRLHRALAGGGREPEAVLTPDGRLEDASGPARGRTARAQLRDAVLAMERARGPLRRRDEALALWPALVEGRWSLVDRFETGGRRYVVAVKNDVEVADPRALTPRERVIACYLALGRANKHIAYELGVAENTIGVLATRIARKCGVRSRAALARFLDECATGEATVARVGDAVDVAVLRSRAAAHPGLSPRERQIARAAADGLTNREIAARLRLSPKTVANAIARAFRKLGVGSRAELARHA